MSAADAGEYPARAKAATVKKWAFLMFTLAPEEVNNGNVVTFSDHPAPINNFLKKLGRLSAV
jgi:hypothetical protein